MHNPDCIFCKIVEEKAPCHKVWEDEKHLAFLSINPNTDGFTIVITKEHYSSDALENDDNVLAGLILASKRTAQKLKKAFPDVGRVGLFFEGFGVDHLHSKLFPMHGTGDIKEWEAIESKRMSKDMHKKFFDRYEGYLSSHAGEMADQKKLAEIAEKIRNAS